MNLILTDKCTNSCPYCFAALEMTKDLSKNTMTKENFDVFMDFLSKEKEPQSLNVIGGEPLIYPHLDYILRKLYDAEFISDYIIFTGGIVKSSVMDKLLPYKDKILVLFNLNEKDSYRNPLHHEIVLNNIKHCVDSGLRISIGFNIYHHGFNGGEIIDICNTYGVTDLRFSVACPIYKEKSNTVVPPEEYKELSPKVFEFLHSCFDNGITAYLDCPIPMCFFSDEQIGKLAKMHPQVVSRLGQCCVPLDINHDLKVFRCFSFSNYTDKSLGDFDSVDDIRQYFIDAIDSRLPRPDVFESCADCSFNKQCHGGCLSNNSEFLHLPNKEEKMLAVFKLLENEEFEEALSVINAMPSPTAMDILLKANICYQQGDVENAVKYARQAIHNAKSSVGLEQAGNLLKAIQSE